LLSQRYDRILPAADVVNRRARREIRPDPVLDEIPIPIHLILGGQQPIKLPAQSLLATRETIEEGHCPCFLRRAPRPLPWPDSPFRASGGVYRNAEALSRETPGFPPDQSRNCVDATTDDRHDLVPEP